MIKKTKFFPRESKPYDAPAAVKLSIEFKNESQYLKFLRDVKEEWTDRKREVALFSQVTEINSKQ